MLPPRAVREQRPGGRFSSPTVVEDLLRLAAIERCVAHVIAGWVPKVPELDEKIGLASLFEETMSRASAMRQQALTLAERDEATLMVAREIALPLRELDAGTPATQAPQVVAAIIVDARAFLLERYREIEKRLDSLLDARLIPSIRAAIVSHSSAVSPIGAELPQTRAVGRLRRHLEASWRSDGQRVHLDAIAWSPLDRVPVPARPAERTRPPVGTRAHFRKGSRLTMEDLSGELNDNVMAELSALELVCRCSYEHPEQPWSSHLAMARHATDEGRHAAIFRRLMAQNSIDESALPQHGANYEYGYEFPECEPGSERELAWRLLILCTVLEALAIDKLPVEIAGRDWVGQYDFARALDYISTDELYHAENGLRLSWALCEKLGLHPTLERELVHGRFFGRQRDVRQAYLDADPERAAAEIAILEAPDPDGVPYGSRTEVELRLRSSFTIDDCEQVERWGYNPVRHQLLDSVSSAG